MNHTKGGYAISSERWDSTLFQPVSCRCCIFSRLDDQVLQSRSQHCWTFFKHDLEQDKVLAIERVHRSRKSCDSLHAACPDAPIGLLVRSGALEDQVVGQNTSTFWLGTIVQVRPYYKAAPIAGASIQV